ncbi:MAG: hypothetical protein A2487_00755 [Candidatus Raymondbacteria bacterium RifOxyC12_full_50_8]|uniref:HTH tetR-type domain-containing protein n=1 Tax=Candidatus Raymondbacteria bacterium RIFOXYD12_FULL_49_13 TaxID=1817890 RepID=A0A1F7F9I4_UNCRA|nr:MAG: hypothetical protein A2350_03330 [Candidatus Raymondbacteria bacterium RifOxyB12_full_50_8]OGJ93257.1 MAG: hypothetical protein A2248_17975 [Candidatus Raymondbacteria bacterium RIFOXYA2_FULL_49_16]OGJ98162.1 MAG: hypothetical protein A2487_00755 [Candidatus Raymondbacteria bacterium RifOxyC12_full_50_8]OGK03339.1 MAG: hypothetical protein A2519_15320 [Candidatus Raymondbacteria bacterium RIFOXYD12_FULL_49_13]OGP44979.1 MAG: hypothetical protein A2324_19900 [Candidatus Raymondbacteria b
MGITERKQREKEQRAEQIISAAENLFIDNGLAKTTMDDIAKECELSKATLYLYYKSKEELVIEIVKRALDNLYEHLSAAAAVNLSGSDRLRVVGRSYLEFYREHPWYFKMINGMGEFGTHQTEGDPHLDMKNNILSDIASRNYQIWDVCVECVKKGIDSGEFKPTVDPVATAVGLYASSNGVILMLDHIKQHERYFQDKPNPFPIPVGKIDDIYIKIWEYTIDSIVTTPENPEQKRAMWQTSTDERSVS